MPKASPILENFNAGEWSPLMEGRVSLEKYRNALKTSLNGVPFVQGPWTRRPGTKFAHPLRDSSAKGRLQRFEFSTTQAYMLAFEDQRLRFFRNNAIITAAAQNITGITKANPAVVTYDGADTYANGDRVAITGVVGMTQVNNREFTVANVNTGANTFELSGVNSSAYDAYTSGGTVAEIYEIATPYLTAHLFELKFTQSADVLYITHPSYAPRKLTRTGHTAWTLSTVSFLDGPYLPTNTTTTTLTPSAASGVITVTASAALFASTDVGRLSRIGHIPAAWAAATAYSKGAVVRNNGNLYICTSAGTSAASGGPSGTGGAITDDSVVWKYVLSNDGLYWGWGTITGFTSSTQVSVTITRALGGTAAVDTWRLGVWSATTGYPAASTFYEDRLWFAGATSYPQRLDGSKSGDYENFAPSDEAGAVADDNAVAFTLNASDVNVVRWLADDEKGLLVGTVRGEWILRPATTQEALSPTNVSAKQSTKYGSANLQPVQVGNALLFVTRSARKMRELAYVYEVDGFRSPDMSLLAHHITDSGIVQIAHQQDPQSIVWCVRNDGVLLGLSYDREQNVIGWHRHILGGRSDAGGTANPVVESVAVIPDSTGTRDEVWLIVRRYINGATVRTIEYMAKFREEGDDREDAYYVDGGLTYDSTAATTITGLWHLEGQTVKVLVDGATHPDRTVANGKITLTRAGSVVHVGHGYNSDMQPLRVDAGAADGTAQGKKQRKHRVIVRVWETLGIQVGVDADNLYRPTIRTTADDAGAAPPLFTGDIECDLEGDYTSEPDMFFRFDQPLPGTILAIMPHQHTQDR